MSAAAASHQVEADERRSGDAGWAAPPRNGARSSRRALVAVAVLAALAAGGWWGAGSILAQQAKQQVADRWDALRICLLGEGLEPGLRPSERFRFVWLGSQDGPAHADWPGRCEPFAQQLDAALATRAAYEQLGPLPSAVTIVRSSHPAEHADDLDLLHGELEMADLPLPRRSGVVPPAPGAARPLMRAEDLGSLGRAPSLGAIDASLDLQNGRMLRLLLREPDTLVCRLNDGPRDQRWQSIACRSVPLDHSAQGKLRLAPSEPGAADLIQIYDGEDSDGFYDATTGQRIWRPRYFDTQAVVRHSGVTTILHGETREGHELEQVERFRLSTLRPGKRPSARTLRIPAAARVLLMANSLLWWGGQQGEDAQGPASSRDQLFAVDLGDGLKEPAARRGLGDIPSGSRHVASCASGDRLALLMASGVRERRYTLLLRSHGRFSPPLDVGVIGGRLELSCQDGGAVLSRLGETAITLWRCTADGCARSASHELPMLREGAAALAPLNDEVVLVWTRPGEALRIRSGPADRLHQLADTLILDDADHDGLEVEALRLVSADGVALLLVQDLGGRIHPLRLTPGKPPTPVSIVR